MKFKGFFIPIIFFFLSCEKAIEFVPRSPEPKVVVEAIIESDRFPIVYLSTSFNYFSKISLDDLSRSFISGANISISNGSHSYPLVEYSIPIADGYSLHYYTVDSTNISGAFKGVEGGWYELTIDINDQQYTAETTIPLAAKKLDSLNYEEYIDDEDSSKVVLYGKFSDPPGFGNYIRYFTSVDGSPYRPGLNSVFDDQVIDGKIYKVQIEQGIDRNSEIDFEEYSYFHRGDTISVKFCNIDKAVYDFWRTMEYSYASIGNPFSSPTRILGNISNGALGYFGGYSVQYANIIIPE